MTHSLTDVERCSKERCLKLEEARDVDARKEIMSNGNVG